jgi:hypoxanthine phosphoribosyltransferase
MTSSSPPALPHNSKRPDPAASVVQEYVTPDRLLLLSCKLGKMVLDSGFRPDFIVGVWRGGAPIGIAVQEFLHYHGIRSDHICIRTSSYESIGVQGKTVAVHGLQYIVERAEHGHSVLLVDDIFDTGRSMKAILDTLAAKMRRNLPKDIRIATVFWKPAKNQTSIKPDYYVETSSAWLVFPHELEAMTKEDILRWKGPEIAALFDDKPHQ